MKNSLIGCIDVQKNPENCKTNKLAFAQRKQIQLSEKLTTTKTRTENHSNCSRPTDNFRQQQRSTRRLFNNVNN